MANEQGNKSQSKPEAEGKDPKVEAPKKSNGLLTVDDHKVELPRVEATAGADGLAINKVLATTGTTTYDPGFTNTASASSAITYIDGGNGILRYRGYPIEQLAKNSSFLEVAYLLIYGELPMLSRSRLLRVKRHRSTRISRRSSAPSRPTVT